MTVATPSTPAKIAGELGWTPAETFETGMRKTVEWYLANQDWVANVRSGEYRKWIEGNYHGREQIAGAQ